MRISKIILNYKAQEIGRDFYLEMPSRAFNRYFEQEVTGGLGYSPIRGEKNGKPETYEDLIRHLGKMDLRVLSNLTFLENLNARILFANLVIADARYKGLVYRGKKYDERLSGMEVTLRESLDELKITIETVEELTTRINELAKRR